MTVTAYIPGRRQPRTPTPFEWFQLHGNDHDQHGEGYRTRTTTRSTPNSFATFSPTCASIQQRRAQPRYDRQRSTRCASVRAERRAEQQPPEGLPHAIQASARRSVRPFCPTSPSGATEIAIHLGRRSPDGSCGRPEGWAAHLSLAPVTRRRVAPSYLALLRWSFPFHSTRPPAPPTSIVTVALTSLTSNSVTRHPALRSSDFLTPRDGSPPSDARPSDRLADSTVRRRRPSRPSSDRAPPHPPPPTGGLHPVDRLVRERVRDRVQRARCVRADQRSSREASPRAADHSGMSLASLTRQRPASCSTMSFESSSRWTSRPPAPGQLERPDDARVLGDVVRLDARGSPRSRRPGPPVSSRASGRARSNSAAPSEAGPGCRARRRRCG